MSSTPNANEPRINERIRIREVRLISADGKQLGVVPTPQALEMARTEGLDLVEVAPEARPPVARIMDYGKYKYEKKKQQQESRKKAHAVQIKEVRLRPKTEKHDFNVKLGKARQFLEEGDKVQVNLMFRGREMVHLDVGRDLLLRFCVALQDLGKVERPPSIDGKRMSVIVAKK